MMFVDGTWQSLPGATAISVLYEPGSTAHGYSPNQLHAVRHNLSSLYLGLDSCIILDMASLTCLPFFSVRSGTGLGVVSCQHHCERSQTDG